jgi:hypothetical protein
MVAKLNPDVQRHALRLTPLAALGQDSATLAELAGGYGQEAVTLLLRVWLEELCRFCRASAGMMLDESQLRQAADLLYAEAERLNVAELALFFISVKRGDYGKFYGAVDAQSILCFLQEYKRERSAAMQLLRRRREQQLRREEYERMLKIKPLTEEELRGIRDGREQKKQPRISDFTDTKNHG